MKVTPGALSFFSVAISPKPIKIAFVFI